MDQLYEVFISFKNLDENGLETKDSLMAEMVYKYLTDRGIKAFYSNITLEKLGVSAYQKVIDENLDAAKLLIAIGTSRNNIDSPWVRYEWSSFFNDIISGVKPESKIFCYIDHMNAFELPRALRQTQVITAERDSLKRLYNFIVNALGKTSALDIVNSNESILKAVEEVMSEDKAVKIGSMVTFLSSKKNLLFIMPTFSLNLAQTQTLKDTKKFNSNSSFEFTISDGKDMAKEIAVCIIEANLLLNPDIDVVELNPSYSKRPSSVTDDRGWYKVTHSYGSFCVDIECKLCGYSTDFSPEEKQDPPATCPYCGHARYT